MIIKKNITLHRCLFRFIFSCVFVFNFLHVYSQKNFIINGKINGRDSGFIFLNYFNNKKNVIHDTARIYNGKFLFSGEINQPLLCSIFTIGTGNRTSIFIEPKQQQLILNENHFDEKKMIGSLTQYQYDSLEDIVGKTRLKYSYWLNLQKDFLKELKSINDSLSKISIENKIVGISEKIETMNAEVLDSTILFISSHPDSYVSPTNLYSILISNRLPSESVKKLYNNLSFEIKKSFIGILIIEELDKRKTKIDAPDFVTRDIYNKKISLSQFKGKYVLLNFWASWCAPCLEKIPILKQYYNSYNAKGFEIINISIDKQKQKWLEAVKEYKLESFCNLITNDKIDSKFPNTKEPIPSEILVSPQGKVLWNSKNQNDFTLTEILENFFSKHK